MTIYRREARAQTREVAHWRRRARKERMSELLLGERDQASIRAIIASEPVPGILLSDELVRPDDTAVDGPVKGVATLSLGVRIGADDVVRLWLVRRTSEFSDRDRALLRLISPALERLLRERRVSSLPPSLTVQERRVLHHVAAGLTNAEVAERLVVAPCTVRKHLENAYRKLGVRNRLAAVAALEGRGGIDDADVTRPDALV